MSLSVVARGVVVVAAVVVVVVAVACCRSCCSGLLVGVPESVYGWQPDGQPTMLTATIGPGTPAA